jgi:hypothetical protein
MTSLTDGSLASSPARKSRNRACGIIVMYGNFVGRRVRFASSIGPSGPSNTIRSIFAFASARTWSANPSASISSIVEGWTVSPRKSRSKSSCSSKIVV